MKVPYRFQKLAKVAQELITVMRQYRRDGASKQVTLQETARDVSDLITLSWTDSGFDGDEQKAIAAELVADLRNKFDLRK